MGKTLKGWPLALGASVALHLLVLGFASVPQTRTSARPAQASSFDFVVAAPEPEPLAAIAEVKSQAFRSRKIASPQTQGTSSATALGIEPSEVGRPIEVSVLSPQTLEAGSFSGAKPHGATDVSGLVYARLTMMAEQCYPPVARRFAQRGTVEVSFCADAEGKAVSVVVTHSSGINLLDTAASGCVVERAAPFPRAASGLCFQVPVRFGPVR